MQVSHYFNYYSFLSLDICKINTSYLFFFLIALIFLVSIFIWILESTWGFPGGTVGKESACPCRRHKRCGFDPWVVHIHWRRAWQPTPVFLPGESPWTEQPGGLQSVGWQRVRRLSTHALRINLLSFMKNPVGTLFEIALNFDRQIFGTVDFFKLMNCSICKHGMYLLLLKSSFMSFSSAYNIFHKDHGHLSLKVLLKLILLLVNMRLPRWR